MNEDALTEAQWEDVSALADGELPAGQSDAVARRAREDPAWRRAQEELAALDRLLEAYAVPAAGADLVERIIARLPAKAPSAWGVGRVIRYLAPAAAAAAIILGVEIYRRVPQAAPYAPEARQVSKALQGIPERDQFVVENLDLFRNYEVLVNLETIEAIQRLETPRGT